MKTRAALLVVTFCCAAVTWLNFVRIRETISNQRHEIQTQKESLSAAELELANLRAQLDKSSVDLRQSQNAEEVARREKKSVQAKLEAELTHVHLELDRANAELVAQASTAGLERISKAAAKQIEDLQVRIEACAKDNKALKETVRRAQIEKSHVLYCPPFVSLPGELRGRVLTHDPKWQFVVVDVGQEQGAKPRGELLVSRNGQLIGWLVISKVEKDRCIANVKRGWQLTEVLEGDSVMPAQPESYLDLFL